MLGKWLPGLFGSQNEGIVSTDLRVGDATQIDGNIPSTIRDRYTLPAYTTAQQVLDQAEVSGTLKAQQWLHTKFSRHRLKQLQNLATMYKNQLAYSQEAMKVEEDLQRTRAQHGEAVIRHAFGSQEQQRQLGGYEKAFDEVGDSFRF
ncbi:MULTISPECIES: hypothetical protein [Nostoc]|uniref:Uncharacterized protein n=1 Tax=Nostoc paludosum FACHB-159 TaxID=2692908 RepID=A0ABR8KJP2_9NOSO|nr:MULTISPECIES: hypothetical protein [Nostoc]MBD2682961.1 hypothetical protein [Nostoc sp. FACHB-857]MBD2739300.1 hypothetical protein [Nostoc paludosum FACHB-159]